MIARSWRGWVAAARVREYADFVVRTGLAEYAATPGNLGAHLLIRETGDGRAEVVTLSFWESMDAVRQFAGDDPDQAVLYPGDEEFLLEQETTVAHFEVPWSHSGG